MEFVLSNQLAKNRFWNVIFQSPPSYIEKLVKRLKYPPIIKSLNLFEGRGYSEGTSRYLSYFYMQDNFLPFLNKGRIGHTTPTFFVNIIAAVILYLIGRRNYWILYETPLPFFPTFYCSFSTLNNMTAAINNEFCMELPPVILYF